MGLIFYEGSLLFEDGKLAMSLDCCCETSSSSSSSSSPYPSSSSSSPSSATPSSSSPSSSSAAPSSSAAHSSSSASPTPTPSSSSSLGEWYCVTRSLYSDSDCLILIQAYPNNCTDQVETTCSVFGSGVWYSDVVTGGPYLNRNDCLGGC